MNPGERVDIVYDAFLRQADGSWTSTRVSDVVSPRGAIRIGPGMDFTKGRTICGVDVAAVLDGLMAARGQPRPAAEGMRSAGR